MQEMHFHWRRMVPIALGLASLAALAWALLSYSNERLALLVSQDTASGDAVSQGELEENSATLYKHPQYSFSLRLPRTWEGYRVLESDLNRYKAKAVAIALPLERYKNQLEEPQDLKQGVLAVGVVVTPKEQLTKEGTFCWEQRGFISRLNDSLGRGEKVTLSREEVDIVQRCQPLIAEGIDGPNFLGENEHFIFSRIPLAAFDNGFREDPQDLLREIEAIYGSFQADGRGEQG